MNKETIVSTRPDRELKKKIITPGDYTLVPYEDSRCRINLSDVKCTNVNGNCEIEANSRIFSGSFDGNVLIGDSDCFIDQDFELILQQMCCGEVCEAQMVYRDNAGVLVKEISCKIELREVTEEQLISDWSWQRLYEAATHHKECGVQLVREKRITDAFRRFNKSLKMLVAIEPIDPETIDADRVKEMVDLRVKLYNNLAHCQLQYNQYDAALELCNRALKHDPDNLKALYRRCVAYHGLNMYEEAWADIQHALKIDPNDKAAQQKANMIRPKIEKINKEYTNLVKKMFS
ncbi:FK506-binding protein-like [Galleria mellonella]|uniref:FK506-binding protein-like n=1 Tax=Galleria mellonella TaxID=7137 RepID=A0A6J1WX05_GALME|nr:FK506-binding protein-like [Galleria mellonella]